MINETPLSLGVKDYLKNNISTNEKILISISCGLDSTVLFDLITKSKYLKNKNIYYLIFDHQKRSEGKYEIKQFIKFYNLSNKNLFLKKVSLKNKINGFQEKSSLQSTEPIKTLEKIQIQESSSIQKDEQKVYGIHDPANYDFNLNMWSSTKADDLRSSLKRLNKINLSNK